MRINKIKADLKGASLQDLETLESEINVFEHNSKPEKTYNLKHKTKSTRNCAKRATNKKLRQNLGSFETYDKFAEYE